MKKVIAIICVLVALILLFPIRQQMKDGGTVVYNAILYDVYDVHKIKSVTPTNGETYKTEFSEGIIIKIFGIEVFNNVR